MNLFERVKAFFRGERIGKLESIDLTWGGAGNQLMKIDGIKYATWVDYTQWPKIGDVVTHRPYKRWYRDGQMLCTNLITHNTPK